MNLAKGAQKYNLPQCINNSIYFCCFWASVRCWLNGHTCGRVPWWMEQYSVTVDLPWYSAMTQSQRYATTLANLLFGTTHSPNHFPDHLSRMPYTGNPMPQSWSCPSPDHSSCGPMETDFPRLIFFELGSLVANPSGSKIRIIYST